MNTPANQNAPEALTPLMRQYWAIKVQNPETVLLYRMGDFYEMFGDDAKIASKTLGLTLTSRNHGSGQKCARLFRRVEQRFELRGETGGSQRRRHRLNDGRPTGIQEVHQRRPAVDGRDGLRDGL